jgi:hypothetical protein
MIYENKSNRQDAREKRVPEKVHQYQNWTIGQHTYTRCCLYRVWISVRSRKKDLNKSPLWLIQYGISQ